jgi:hypothetical protein
LVPLTGPICIFAREWAKILVLPPSSWRQSALVRAALDWFDPGLIERNKSEGA